MISLRPATWVILLSAVLLLLFITFGVALPDPLESWYYRTQIAPELHRDLGFSAEFRNLNTQYANETFVITHVVANGAVARAGIRVGDMPFDFHHSPGISFYRSLEQSRGGVAHVEIVRPGGSTGHGDIPVRMEFDVAVPAKNRQPNSA